MTPVLASVIMLGLLVLVMVFSVCEVVLAHVSVARAAAMSDAGDGRGADLVELLKYRETNVNVVLIARLVAQVGVMALAVDLAQGEGAEGGVSIAVAGAVVLVLAFAEAVAKTVGLVRVDEVSRRVATIVRLLRRVPLLALFGRALAAVVGRRSSGSNVAERPKVSEEELLAFADVAAQADVIETSERALIESIIEFGDTLVREVMVPRPDMITVDAGWRISDVMEIVILNGFSRIPVTGEGIDNVVGLAYAKDLMRAERDGHGHHPVGEHIRNANVVPEQKRVSALLPEMQSQQFHMAIVIDEYGGVSGLVTLEDLIEELVGEIVDEFDVEDAMVEALPGGAYRVNARMPLDEVNDLIGASLPEGDWDTVGGLLFGMLGHVPTVGESVVLAGHRVSAARVQGRRIGLVRLEALTADEVAGLQAEETADSENRPQ